MNPTPSVRYGALQPHGRSIWYTILSMTIVIENVRPWGRAPADILIDGDQITGVVPQGTGSAAERIDGRGLLALPGLINTHAHIDKSWWGMPWVPYGGETTTQGRIAHERAEREKYSIPNADATTGVLREFLRLGTTRVRTQDRKSVV